METKLIKNNTLEKLVKSVDDYVNSLFEKQLKSLHTFNLKKALSKLNVYSLMIDGNENASTIVEALLRNHINNIDKPIFSEEITGDPDFYIKLVNLMKEEPTKHKQQYAPIWDAAINKFTAEFVKDFCYADGRINWEKLVKFVSGKKP